jgi:hypothetical protein
VHHESAVLIEKGEVKFSERGEVWKDSGFKCGWCGDEIPEDTEFFGIGAKARPDIDIKELRGSVIDIFLTRRDRNVQAKVVTEDSPAKKEGKDLLFVVCSESCAEALRQAVGREIELV